MRPLGPLVSGFVEVSADPGFLFLAVLRVSGKCLKKSVWDFGFTRHLLREFVSGNTGSQSSYFGLGLQTSSCAQHCEAADRAEALVDCCTAAT